MFLSDFTFFQYRLFSVLVVNNALTGLGSGPSGSLLKHGAFDNYATGLWSAAKLSQAPCFSQAPEGLDPSPSMRYSLKIMYMSTKIIF